MNVKEKRGIRFRVYLVALFFLFGLGIILVRAYYLQVLKGDEYAALARAGYEGSVKLLPKRGTIYDRQGRELAVSVEVESVYAHPKQVENKLEAAIQLSRTLELHQKKILNRLRSNSSFVFIKRKITPDEVERVKALGFKGVGFITEARRYYPAKETGAHLIGFAGDDNKGLEGLEKRYDSILKGPQYTLVQERDARGRPFYVSQATSPEADMKSLVLTIDRDIQYRAQQVLKAAVEKNKAKRGHCIILDPETGEILAMAVFPLFNPNVFGEYKPHQWRNIAITDCYEPGSTLKAFLAAAALNEKCVSSQDIFYCEQGKFELGNETIDDTKEHGWLTFSDIVVFSSNIGAVKIGQKLGYETFSTYLKDFGFGSKTGIDLIGERSGFLRPIEKTTEIDQATVYYGQGMTATSLQIAVAMAAIANGGKLMRPHVVKAIVDQSGRIVEETKPRVVRRVMSPQTSKKVMRILEAAVTEEGGTGSLAAINGYGAAGKTGTAEKVDPKTKSYSHENYVSSFVGFVPTDKPELVILVMVDEPKTVTYGGLVAAPAFQQVGAWTLHHLRIPPQIRLAEKKSNPGLSKRTSYTKPLSKDRSDHSGLLPDFTGQSMREVLKGGRALGLGVVLEGTGLAVKQTPRPGSSLEKTKTVKVTFSPPV